MIHDVEKPLLSDYQVQGDGKVQDREITQHLHCNGHFPDAGSRTEHNWTQKFQKFDKFAIKIATPISRKAVGLGCEPFVPLPIDQECQKAARIVKRFSYNLGKDTREPLSADATNHEEAPRSHTTSATPHIVTIPPCVIADAVGLIIFTTGRLGAGHLSGSTGSGVLITRRDNREWGTPIPIQAYSLGGGPIAFGAEVTDRVYVLNNQSALDLFKNARFELGPEVVLAAGPYGGGGGVTFSGMSSNAQADQNGISQQGLSTGCSCGHHKGAFQGLRKSLAQPVYCYMRSRGLYAGLQAEGTIFVQNPNQSAPKDAAAVLISALRDAEGASRQGVSDDIAESPASVL